MKVEMANEDRQAHLERAHKYLIRVQGRISQKWAAWFEDMSISVDGIGDNLIVTTLTGEIADQAALQGLLQKLYNLGFPLIEVRRTNGYEIGDERRRKLER